MELQDAHESKERFEGKHCAQEKVEIQLAVPVSWENASLGNRMKKGVE